MTSLAAGLALNPSAPAGLLLRLLDEHPEETRRALHRRADVPREVAEAAARHPDHRIRQAVAGNRDTDPAVRLTLVDDPAVHVLDQLFRDRTLPLPRRTFTRFIDYLLTYVERDMMTADELTGELMELSARHPGAVDAIVAHPLPAVRIAVVQHSATAPGTPLWAALAQDEDPEVREAAIRRAVEEARVHEVADMPLDGYAARVVVSRRRLSPALIAHVFATEQYLYALAGNPHLPEPVVEALVAHPSEEVRVAVAARRDLRRDQVRRLAADPEVTVRIAAAVHPALSEAERAAIDVEVPAAAVVPAGVPDDDTDPLVRVRSLRDPATDPRTLLDDPEPAVRRAAAACPRLPPDRIVALLGDPDAGVAEAAASNPSLPVPVMWSIR